MTRLRALVTAPLRGPGFDKLKQLVDVVYDPWIEQRPLRIYSAEQLAERAAAEHADILVVEGDSVSGPVFDLPLRAIASTRGDPNNVDIAAATAAGIPVLHTPGRNADAVAEMAIALLFAATRHVLTADADVRAGEVFRDGTIPYQRFRAWEIAGRTAGLVGLGAVARALRWRLQGLGVTVIAYDPYNDEAHHSLDELLAEADVVSLHAPVTDDTVGDDRRGPVRERCATAQCSSIPLGPNYTTPTHWSTRCAAERSPRPDWITSSASGYPTDHPLTGMPNVVLTPHIGGATWNTEARQAQIVADGLEALLSGRAPEHIVNPEVLPS